MASPTLTYTGGEVRKAARGCTAGFRGRRVVSLRVEYIIIVVQWRRESETSRDASEEMADNVENEATMIWPTRDGGIFGLRVWSYGYWI